jgi:hypothetical protein
LCSFGVAQATWLVPRRGGITVAGQLRNRTGFAATTPAGGYVPGDRERIAARGCKIAAMSSSTCTAPRGRLSGPIGAAPTTTIIAIAV